MTIVLANNSITTSSFTLLSVSVMISSLDEGYIYHRAKNIGGNKILVNFANYSSLPIFTMSITFPMQVDFNLPKFFSAKLPTVLIRQTFLLPKFFTIRYSITSFTACLAFIFQLKLFTLVVHLYKAC